MDKKSGLLGLSFFPAERAAMACFGLLGIKIDPAAYILANDPCSTIFPITFFKQLLAAR